MPNTLKTYTTVLLTLLLIPSLSLALALLLIDTKLDPDFNIAWFITTFSILASVAGMFYFTCAQIHRVAESIEHTNSQTPKDISTLLSTELRNTRIPLHGKDEVRAEVARLYNEADAATERGDKEIFYFGAASIYPSPREIEDIEAEVDASGGTSIENNSAFIIRDTFDRITDPGSDVVVKRYIKIPGDAELRGRSKPYLTSFANWLDRQVNIIERCPKYTLYAAARAFEYSSLTSFVAGPSGIVEIIGEGHGGAVVRSKAERRNFVNSVSQYLEEASPQNKPKPYHKDNVPDLKKRIEKIRNILSEKESET